VLYLALFVPLFRSFLLPDGLIHAFYADNTAEMAVDSTEYALDASKVSSFWVVLASFVALLRCLNSGPAGVGFSFHLPAGVTFQFSLTEF
jgi:hypothetical protein